MNSEDKTREKLVSELVRYGFAYHLAISLEKPEEHEVRSATERILQLIQDERKEAQAEVLRDVLEQAARPLGTDFDTHKTDIVWGGLLKDRLRRLEEEGYTYE